MNKTKKIYIISAVVAFVLIGGAFYGGMVFGQNKKTSFGQMGQNQNISIRGNKQAGVNSGEIIAKDDKSVTIKLVNGGSKIILFSSTTEVGKFVTGTTSDLEVGKTIMVQGQTNQDGSVTAQSIQLRPIMPTPK
jgi:hypothetical protein